MPLLVHPAVLSGKPLFNLGLLVLVVKMAAMDLGTSMCTYCFFFFFNKDVILYCVSGDGFYPPICIGQRFKLPPYTMCTCSEALHKFEPTSHSTELKKTNAVQNLASQGVDTSTYALGFPSCMNHRRRHDYAILTIKGCGIGETWGKSQPHNVLDMCPQANCPNSPKPCTLICSVESHHTHFPGPLARVHE